MVEGLSRSFWKPRKPSEDAGWWRRLFPGRERSTVIRDLTFSIGEGEFVGYVGPNGSGKSTTIKCLTGVLVPTAGTVRCLGLVPWRDRLEYTARIGVMFGQKSLLFWELPVRDALEVYREIYAVGQADFARWLERFDAIFGVGRLLDRRVYSLSLGERMRCEIAASFLHHPRLVFLDEPTIGLDADARDAMRQLLQELHRRDGVTVMLTTHQMEDIETLCTRIIVLGDGRIRFDGGPAELRRQYLPVKCLRVSFSRIRSPERFEAALARCRVVESGFDFRRLEVPAAVEIAAFTSELLQSLDVIDLEMNDPDLDQVMRIAYAEEPRAE